MMCQPDLARLFTVEQGSSPIVISAEETTYVWHPLREKVAWSEDEGRHIVGQESNFSE